MTEAKNIKAFSEEAMETRLNKMLNKKAEYIDKIRTLGYDEVLKELHLMKGNSKTGKNCMTVSLIPVHDCVNCSKCARYCYDLRNDCRFGEVVNSRALNSALREVDPVRFWKRVGELVHEDCAIQLRINVGGDLRYEDYCHIAQYVAKPNKSCSILFFTKNYNGINNYLSEYETFPQNVHPMMSPWEGMEMENPFNLPCAHVLWADGRTTAPEYGAVYCGGNCSECYRDGNGCWDLKKGEHVIFMAH